MFEYKAHEHVHISWNDKLIVGIINEISMVLNFMDVITNQNWLTL